MAQPQNDDVQNPNLIRREVEAPLVKVDGRISYQEFVIMMKMGADWRKTSRQYSEERFNDLCMKLMKNGSLELAGKGR
uniref:Uncharacterized protein n=1 Tax=Helianthus annuus TaxID=4232 RepID=A0A251VIP5_HELAN